MDKKFMDDLKKCSTKEEIKIFIDDIIDTEIDLQVYNNDFIGIESSVNPLCNFIQNKSESALINSSVVWGGFIPENVKITYASIWPMNDNTGIVANQGWYYYVDNRDFLYDFCYLNKDIDFECEYDLVLKIFQFIQSYFESNIHEGSVQREKMHHAILKDENFCYEPTLKHSLKDFKNNGSAMCSERSAIANNILSLYDVEIKYLMGSVQLPSDGGGHAFNLGVIDGEQYIIDFSIPVNNYDINGTYIGQSPFFGYIPDFNENTLQDAVDNNEIFEFNDYSSIVINGCAYDIEQKDNSRFYAIGNMNRFDKNIVKTK